MTMTKRQHPSVRFQNGEVRDFYTAMDTYIAQFREELLLNREIYRDYAQDHDEAFRQKWQKEIEEQRQSVENIEKRVRQARAIYRELVDDATKRAAQIMRSTGDSTLDQIADAVESGDWSQLAI